MAIEDSTGSSREREPFMALALPFDVEKLAQGERREFIRGYEVGTLHYEALNTDAGFSREVQPENAEMCMRIAEATKRTVRSTDSEHGLLVFFGRKGSA